MLPRHLADTGCRSFIVAIVGRLSVALLNPKLAIAKLDEKYLRTECNGFLGQV